MMGTQTSKTLFEKVWEQHLVVPETADTPAVLYIDLHLTHEVTTPQAFAELARRGLQVRRPDLTLATLDHSTPTLTAQVFGGAAITNESAANQIRLFERNCREFGVELFGLRSAERGIVHIIGPELGLTQPGKTIVCGDSHTSTHGAFGALAFGIGTTEVGHVLATQCLLQRRPKTLAIEVDGQQRQPPAGGLAVGRAKRPLIPYRPVLLPVLLIPELLPSCSPVQNRATPIRYRPLIRKSPKSLSTL